MAFHQKPKRLRESTHKPILLEFVPRVPPTNFNQQPFIPDYLQIRECAVQVQKEGPAFLDLRFDHRCHQYPGGRRSSEEMVIQEWSQPGSTVHVPIGECGLGPSYNVLGQDWATLDLIWKEGLTSRTQLSLGIQVTQLQRLGTAAGSNFQLHLPGRERSRTGQSVSMRFRPRRHSTYTRYAHLVTRISSI